ncbi:MAG: hypothetical protein KDB65_00740 [Calditrichaeota bacterium]|nr:hypothetical protein [Calditrichota bacterium]MCB9369257.1 hypothetical protein [Calditrichota bacterium]
MYLYLSAVLLTLAAAVGFNPLWHLVKKIPAKMKFVWIHGGLAILGVTFFIIHATTSPDPTPWLAFLLTIVTAMGGIALFALRRMKAPIPAGIALIHPLAGAVAVVLLIQALFSK